MPQTYQSMRELLGDLERFREEYEKYEPEEPKVVGVETEELEKRVKRVIAELGKDVRNLSLKTMLADIGDSLDLVEITMALEEEFDIAILDEDAEGIKTIGQAVDYISERMEENKGEDTAYSLAGDEISHRKVVVGATQTQQREKQTREFDESDITEYENVAKRRGAGKKIVSKEGESAELPPLPDLDNQPLPAYLNYQTREKKRVFRRNALLISVLAASVIGGIWTSNQRSDGPVDGPAEPKVQQKENIYVVEGGDTLSEIARDHGVSLDKILALNPEITNPRIIEIGQRIKMPEDVGRRYDSEAEVHVKGGVEDETNSLSAGTGSNRESSRSGNGTLQSPSGNSSQPLQLEGRLDYSLISDFEVEIPNFDVITGESVLFSLKDGRRKLSYKDDMLLTMTDAVRLIGLDIRDLPEGFTSVKAPYTWNVYENGGDELVDRVHLNFDPSTIILANPGRGEIIRYSNYREWCKKRYSDYRGDIKEVVEMKKNGDRRSNAAWILAQRNFEKANKHATTKGYYNRNKN